MNRIQVLEQQNITLPIPEALRQMAVQFAAEQATPAKQRQVFNNTLAVGSTNNYLALMDFPTDLSASDCWNPLLRSYADVSDLLVIDIGCLECRPLSSPHTCHLPLTLPEDRVGLVLVDLDANYRQATIWGFTPTVVPGAIVNLNELQPLETLLQYLDVQQQAQATQIAQWFLGKFVHGWQPVEALLETQQWNLLLSWRTAHTASQVTGAKLLDLGLEVGTQPFVLLMTVTSEADQTLRIRVQLHPSGGTRHLPAHIALTLCSEAGDVIHSVAARTADNFIQLPEFRCQSTEMFSLQVSLADITVAELFNCSKLFSANGPDDAD